MHPHGEVPVSVGSPFVAESVGTTTHGACYRELAAYGAEPSATRVIEHLEERIITAAGVSSGIDMALPLVELLVEYDPRPPFDSGAVHKSDDTVMTRVIEYAAARA